MVATACFLLLAGVADAQVATIRPDAKVAGPDRGDPQPFLSFPGFGEEIGDNIYGNLAGQATSATLSIGEREKVRFRAENDGSRVDTFRMKVVAALAGAGPVDRAAPTQRVGDFRVKYFRGGKNVTHKVSAGTLRERNVAPGSHARAIVAKIRLVAPPLEAVPSTAMVLLFSVHSVKDPLQSDVAQVEILGEGDK